MTSAPMKLNVGCTTILPHRQATPVGQDTIWVILRAHNGHRELAFDIFRYPIPVHEGKKNGGPAYTRWFSILADVPAATQGGIVASLLVVNRAGHLDKEAARGLIALYDDGIAAQVAAGQPNALTQLVNGVKVLSEVLGSTINLTPLFQAAGRLFANADAVVAYNRMELDTNALNAGPVNLEVTRQSALGGRAVYSTCLKVWQA